MFALAFALKLTPDETAELFHKVYLDRAFDYRNANEIIYYFCLYNQKTRQEARHLINSISVSEISIEDLTVYTAKIKTEVEAFSDETALLSYIFRHGHNLTKKNVTAKQTVEKLIAKARIKAKEETELQQTDDAFRGKARESNNFVYEVITGLSVTGVKGTKTLFKNANLPGEIKKRFPEALTLSKKDPTYEELRKLIILLFSYCYWYKKQSKNTVIELDDYIEEINVHLNESGFSLMYYGNPYDWLFLYCTLSERPLDIFRGLLACAVGNYHQNGYLHLDIKPSKGLKKGGKKTQPDPFKWCKTTVGKILAQQEYCGDVINFKTYSKNFKNKTRMPSPEENWRVFKNVHEPIIDRETFETVQKMKAKAKRRAPNPEHAEKNMFCGLLYCADCGSPLWFNVNHPNTAIQYFMCSNYKGRRGTCEGTHYIRADSLEQIVMLELRKLASFLTQDEEAFTDILEAKTNKNILNHQKFLESSIDKSVARTQEISLMYEKLLKNTSKVLSPKKALCSCRRSMKWSGMS